MLYNKPPSFAQPRQPQAYQPPPPHQVVPPSQNSSLEELVKAMAVTQSQLQQNTQALQQSQIAFQNNTQDSLKNLETQVSQLARELSEIRTQGSGKLPSQTVVNPGENVSAITLRSDKQVEKVLHKAEKPSLPPSNH